MAVNFKLVSEFQTIGRRSFEIDPVGILDPNNAQPLVDGEWLQLTATTYKMTRGSVEATVPSYCFFAEKGRYETQALGKGPMLYLGVYECDTKIMDVTGAAVGDAVSVQDVTLSAIVRRALKKATATDGTKYIVGRITRLPANNGGFMRVVVGVN